MSAYVYRAFDAEDRLLYIGSSNNPASRMSDHEKHSPWWPFHTRMTLERHDTRAEARAAEALAIATEHPRWNVKDRSPDHPEGRMNNCYGRFSAPWLRADIETWRQWKRDRAAALGGVA